LMNRDKGASEMSRLTEVIQGWARESGDELGWLRDVAEHGCSSGIVPALIYTKDILDIYNEHEDEIIEILDSTEMTDHSMAAADPHKISTLGEWATARVWTAVEIISVCLFWYSEGSY